MTVPGPRVRGQFLSGPGGPLALVVWDPPPNVPPRFAALFVPAAFEEMNKARRMVAVQARALAAIGGRVALLDPRGTGDSGGDHGDATWGGWCDDVLAAWQWLASESAVPTLLWGMRLGALLAADLVASGRIAPAALVLWQPVASGRAYFTQFLRLATAQQMLGAGGSGSDLKALRATLAEGKSIEVAGYALHPSLVGDAEAVDMTTLPAPHCRILWRETSVSERPTLSPWAEKVTARWQTNGTEVNAAATSGPSFWAAQEIVEAPQLIASTTSAISAWFGDVERHPA